MTTEPLKLRELKEGDEVAFIPRTENCGRAEFQFCPVWEVGYIKEVWIYPRQQPHATEFFVYRSGAAVNLLIDSWKHKNIGPPWIWLFGWCGEHNCMSILVYPPEGTSRITVRGGASADFHFEAED